MLPLINTSTHLSSVVPCPPDLVPSRGESVRRWKFEVQRSMFKVQRSKFNVRSSTFEVRVPPTKPISLSVLVPSWLKLPPKPISLQRSKFEVQSSKKLPCPPPISHRVGTHRAGSRDAPTRKGVRVVPIALIRHCLLKRFDGLGLHRQTEKLA